MKVVLVSHYALPHVGGIESALHAIASGLTSRGHRVVHVASAARRPAERQDSFAAAGYRRALVPAANFPEERFEAPYPLFGPSLARVLRRELEDADVVHAHGFLYMGTLAALALSRRRGIPTALTEHVGHVHYANPVLDRAQAAAVATLGRWSSSRADVLVAFNDKVRAQLARLAPGKRIEWIGNGVDPDRFHPPDRAERDRLRDELGWDERPRVLFVGRRVAKKGLDVALATAAAADSRFRLAVAGTDRVDGADVDLLGHVEPHRMPGVYRAADALLLPSHGEGFPVAVQEAMASGLPVVLVADPAYEPHLRGAEAGAVRLVEPRPELLAEAVAEVVDDADRRAASGAAAAEHARRHFSFDRVLDAHETLYRDLARSRRT